MVPEFEVVDGVGRIRYGDRYGVQLARLLDVSQPMLSECMTGRRRLPGHVLKRMAPVCATEAHRIRVDADTLERIADTTALPSPP